MIRIALVLALFAAGCARGGRKPVGGAHDASSAAVEPALARPGQAVRVPGEPVAAGSLRTGEIVDAYAVVVPRDGDAAGVLATMRAAPTPDGLTAIIEAAPVTEVAVELELLERVGTGLDAAQIAAIRAASTIVRVGVGGDGARSSDVSHAAAAIARVGAARAGGWIVDLPTHTVFSRTAFDVLRPDGFALDAVKLIAVHMISQDDGAIFLESFGMARFGLPELFMRDVPRSFGDETVQLIDAAAQTLLERGGLERDGVLAIDLARLSTSSWLDRREGVVAAGGSGRASFTAVWSLGDDHADAGAEPDIELSVTGGASRAERLAAVIAAYGGSEGDTVFRSHHDDDRLLAASDRARAELRALAPHFARGVPDMERLLVKGPFATDSGNVEWMWVEVHAWKGTRLSGILINQPEEIAALKVGAHVEVALDDVFDYLHSRADGSEAGGETDRILQGE